MDIILYLILSSIPRVPQWGNISSDDVPILQDGDIKVGTLKLQSLEKNGALRAGETTIDFVEFAKYYAAIHLILYN